MIWLGHLLLSSIGLLGAGLFALIGRWFWRRDASASYRFLVLLLLAALTLPALQWLVQGRAAAESASQFWAKVEAWAGPADATLGTPLTEVHEEWDPTLVAELELLDLGALPPVDATWPSAAPVAGGWWSRLSSRHALTGYLLGVLAFLGWYLVRWGATRRLLRSCQPVQDHVVLETWRKVAGNDPMSRRTALVQTRRLRSPACWGLLRPTLVLPEGDEDGADPAALEWALRHEQVHLQRGDARVAVLQAVLRTLFWFHPVSWWLSRELDRTRELSCDEQVVKRTGCRKSYALALLDYARSPSAAACPPLLHWTRSPSQLRRRIEMLARRANPLSRRGRWARWMSLSSLVGVLWGGQLSLAAVVFPATQDAGAGQELPPETGSDESAPPATEETFPESGVIMIGDEIVAYSAWEDDVRAALLLQAAQAQVDPEQLGLLSVLALQEDQTALVSNRLAALSALGASAQDNDKEKAELKRKIAELETVLADQRSQLDELRSQLRNSQGGSALWPEETLRASAESLRQRERAEQNAEGARATERRKLLEARRSEVKARSDQLRAEMQDRQAQLQLELQLAMDQGRLDEAKSLEHQLKDTMVEADVRASELADAMMQVEEDLAAQSADVANQASRALALQRQMDEKAMQKDLMARDQEKLLRAYEQSMVEAERAMEEAAQVGDHARAQVYQQYMNARQTEYRDQAESFRQAAESYQENLQRAHDQSERAKAQIQQAQARMDEAKAVIQQAEQSLRRNPNDVNMRLRYQKAHDAYDENSQRYRQQMEELKASNIPQGAEDAYRKALEFYIDLESHAAQERDQALKMREQGLRQAEEAGRRGEYAGQEQLLLKYGDLKAAERVTWEAMGQEAKAKDRAAAERARDEAVAADRKALEAMVKDLQNQLEALKAAGFTEDHPRVQALRSRFSVTPLPSELPAKIQLLPPAKQVPPSSKKGADTHCDHCDHQPCVEIQIIIQKDGEEPEPDAEPALLPKAVTVRESAPISKFLRDF